MGTFANSNNYYITVSCHPSFLFFLPAGLCVFKISVTYDIVTIIKLQHCAFSAAYVSIMFCQVA